MMCTYIYIYTHITKSEGSSGDPDMPCQRTTPSWSAGGSEVHNQGHRTTGHSVAT